MDLILWADAGMCEGMPCPLALLPAYTQHIARGMAVGDIRETVLQEATAVVGAVAGHVTSADSVQLLINKQTALEVWEGSNDNVTCVVRVPQTTRVDYCTLIAPPSTAAEAQLDFLLVVSAHAQACSLLSWDAHHRTFREVSAAAWPTSTPATLQTLARKLRHMRPGASVVASPLALAAHKLSKDERWLEPWPNPLCTMILLSVDRTAMHVVRILWRPSGPKLCVDVLDAGDIVGQHASSSCVAKSMCFIGHGDGKLRADAEGCFMLTVLLDASVPGEPALHLECCALDLLQKRLLPGPWKVRNVHPTSSLVLPGTSAGTVLLVDSRRLTEYPPPPDGTPNAVDLHLKASPTTNTCLGQRLLIGDATGSLTIIDLRIPLWQVIKLQYNSATPMPPSSVLCFFGEHHMGSLQWLFAGSYSGNSQLWRRYSNSEPVACDTTSSACGKLQVVSSKGIDLFSQYNASSSAATTRANSEGEYQMWDPAFIDSLAPISDMMEIEDAGQHQLLMCCGNGVAGSVRVAQVSAALDPASTDGPVLPGQPQLLILKDSWHAEDHSYLLLSSLLQDRTDVMCIEADTCRLSAIGGLDCEHATLACGVTPRNWIVQVTTAGVNVLAPSPVFGRAATWTPGDALQELQPNNRNPKIELASVHESCVALSSMRIVAVLRVESVTGQVTVVNTAVRSNQVSALTLSHSNQHSVHPPNMLVLVAHWGDRSVSILDGSNLSELASVTLSSAPARSLLMMTSANVQRLIIGAADGLVVSYKCSRDSHGKYTLGESHTVTAGSAPVKLHAHSVQSQQSPQPESMANTLILVHSDRTVLLRVSKDTLQVLPVHNGRLLPALAAFNHPAMQNAVAWLTPDHQFTVGQLDTHTKMRWSTGWLGHTPNRLAYHSDSSCAAVLAVDNSGASFVEIVHVPSMQRVASVPMAQGHTALAMVVTPLSSTLAALQRLPPASKSYVLVSSRCVKQTADGNKQDVAYLSVYDLAVDKLNEQQEEYKLSLHGSCILPFICSSLIPFQLPEAESTDHPEADSPPRVVPPTQHAFLAGGPAGVRVFTLLLDEAGTGKAWSHAGNDTCTPAGQHVLPALTQRQEDAVVASNFLIADVLSARPIDEPAIAWDYHNDTALVLDIVNSSLVAGKLQSQEWAALSSLKFDAAMPPAVLVGDEHMLMEESCCLRLLRRDIAAERTLQEQRVPAAELATALAQGMPMPTAPQAAAPDATVATGGDPTIAQPTLQPELIPAFLHVASRQLMQNVTKFTRGVTHANNSSVQAASRHSSSCVYYATTAGQVGVVELLPELSGTVQDSAQKAHETSSADGQAVAWQLVELEG
eukprot:jgi/Chlat1/6235/Chrsp44S05850